MSTGIKLNTYGSNSHIEEPSGKKVTASMLEVGKSYLHYNQSFLREIIRFVGDDVQYFEIQYSHYGLCSRQQFVRTCPHEATQEEIDFLLSRK